MKKWLFTRRFDDININNFDLIGSTLLGAVAASTSFWLLILSIPFGMFSACMQLSLKNGHD